MGLFSNLGTEGLEATEDRLGGFAPLSTDAYEASIKAAYAGQSSGGAHSVTLIADAGGREYRETIYITNKKGENYFLNKNDKTKKVPLPGFTTINDICLVTVESPLSEMETEEKVVNVWDNEAKKELPKSVQMLTALIGQKVGLGIVEQLVNKNEKDGSGTYVPTAETRVENFVDKVFHYPSNMTVVEATNGATAPAFHEAWVAKNKGVQRDRREIKDGAGGGSSGRPAVGAPAAGTAAPKASLFGKK